MHYELVVKIMNEFAALRTKTYSYLTCNNGEDKKVNGIQRCVVKRKRKFKIYKHCLEAAQPENKINYLEKINFMWNSIEKMIKNL